MRRRKPSPYRAGEDGVMKTIYDDGKLRIELKMHALVSFRNGCRVGEDWITPVTKTGALRPNEEDALRGMYMDPSAYYALRDGEHLKAYYYNGTRPGVEAAIKRIQAKSGARKPHGTDYEEDI
jgi:hypothetical protein